MKTLFTPFVLLGIVSALSASVPDISIANKIAQATKGTPSAIDGLLDTGWDSSVLQPCTTPIIQGPDRPVTEPESEADLSGGYRAIWDDAALYLFISVTDDTLQMTTGNGFEVYTSAAYTRNFGEWANSGYDGLADAQIMFKLGGTNSVVHGLYSYGGDQTAIPAITLATVATASGYNAEIKLPWSVILGKSGIIYENGMLIGGPDSSDVGAERDFLGFDVFLQDEDTGDGDRDHKLAWFGGPEDRRGNFAWADTQVWGTLQLVTSITPPPTTILATGCSANWAVYDGNFKWHEGTGFVYDGFFPYIYDFAADNWFYVFNAETANETDGYFLYDFRRSKFGFISCDLYAYGYAELPLADPVVYTKLSAPVN